MFIYQDENILILFRYGVPTEQIACQLVLIVCLKLHPLILIKQLQLIVEGLSQLKNRFQIVFAVSSIIR